MYQALKKSSHWIHGHHSERTSDYNSNTASNQLFEGNGNAYVVALAGILAIVVVDENVEVVVVELTVEKSSQIISGWFEVEATDTSEILGQR
jgi:hypothetical protein